MHSSTNSFTPTNSKTFENLKLKKIEREEEEMKVFIFVLLTAYACAISPEEGNIFFYFKLQSFLFTLKKKKNSQKILENIFGILKVIHHIL